MKCIEDEIPFELPRGWEWCRFNCVLDVRDGTHDTPSYIPNGIPLITSKNLSEGGIDYSNVKYISHEDALLINERSGVDKGDILFAMIGTIGNPAMVSDDKLISIKNVALFKFTYSLNINHKYIMAYLDYTQDDMKKRPSGGLQPFVSLNFLRQYFVPIPPISEQHRIVDKLNELLSFVDTIETDKTSLQDLIKQTKSKILDLAIRGKLVPQEPNDEPASVLLERIRAEKEELIKQGKIKRDKKESVIFKGDDNSYYQDLPQNWQVSTLREVTTPLTLNDGDWILSENMTDNGEVKLLQLGSIGNMSYIDKGFKYLTKDTFDELSCTEIFAGYLIINRIISDKMCCCIVPDIDGTIITTVDTCWIAPSETSYDIKFLMYQLASPSFQSAVLLKATGTTRKRISKNNLIDLHLLLPPLAEQRRIVHTIEALFAQIDKISEQIS